jgi:hypothetical protein
LPIVDVGGTSSNEDIAETGSWTLGMLNVNYAPWKEGCLVLEVHDTEPKKVYSFSFQLTNSYNDQYPPDIFIHLFRRNRFSWTFIMERIMVGAQGNARPFLIQGLASTFATQSLSSKSAIANRINISFVTR